MQQQDGTICGFHAVANLANILNGLDPRVIRVDHFKLRDAVRQFIEDASIGNIPKARGRPPVVQTPTGFEI